MSVIGLVALRACPFEEVDDLGVLGLGEVLVELPDGPEVFGGQGTEYLVRLGPQRLKGMEGSDRDGQDQVGRLKAAEGPQGREDGGPGGDPVVYQNDRP